jgi:hypoxanthine phosphoribosyltransferase
MQEISVHDKNFVPYLSEAEIQHRVKELGQTLSKAFEGKNPLFICILNGAFVFAADLLRAMETPTEIQFVRVSSYGAGMESTGKVKKMMNLETSVEGRHVVIVEDIVDTGNTIEWLRNFFAERNPASFSVACLLFKREAFLHQQEPDYVGFEIPNKFVVGYGLDYAEHGRGLRAIYQIKA